MFAMIFTLLDDVVAVILYGTGAVLEAFLFLFTVIKYLNKNKEVK